MFYIPDYKILVLLISFIIPACSKNDDTLPTPPIAFPLDSINCTDNAEIYLGEMMIQNNVWGKGSITNYQQCIHAIGNSDKPSFEWIWSWPDAGNNVKAYPEIIFGLKPFGNVPTTTKLPGKISEISSVKVSFDSIKTELTGSGNLAFDIWITDSSTPVQSNIKHEVMIWLNHSVMQPAGTFISRILIANEEYDFYSGNVGSWNYHAFVKVVQSELNEIPVGDFLAYLKNNSLISSDEYLSSIEFGNEVVKGSGKTSVYNYKIEIVQ